MDKELLNEIDKVCEEIINRGLVSLTKEDTDLRRKSIRYLESNNLIRNDGKNYRSNSETNKIEKIGIENYLKEIENKKTTQIRKETQEEIIRKKTIEKFRYDKWAFYISIGSVLLTLLLEFLRDK